MDNGRREETAWTICHRLDISRDELAAAPAGAYDEIVVADLCSYNGEGSADVVICQATLEHVPDTRGALRAIASVLKPGGRVFIFAPCRNALFAKLNRALPQSFKKRLLSTLFPYASEGHDGFHALYDLCTPSAIESAASAYGLKTTFKKTFWVSGYFYAFLPAYFLWRLYQGLAWLIQGEDGCETFVLVLQKE